jgi:hypothetical protein
MEQNKNKLAARGNFSIKQALLAKNVSASGRDLGPDSAFSHAALQALWYNTGQLV